MNFSTNPVRGELKNELKKAFSNETIIKAPFKIYPTFIPLESSSISIILIENKSLLFDIFLKFRIRKYKHGDCLTA